MTKPRSISTARHLIHQNDTQSFTTFNPILHISLASESDILNWSNGEVTTTETINYRTYRPLQDGLFCQRIFGPDRDYECACGKFKGTKFKNITCDRCEVRVTNSRVRRHRFGHITLMAPVIHPWLRSAPLFLLPTLLGMTPKDLETVLHRDSYVVITPGRTERFGVQAGRLLKLEEIEALGVHRGGFQYATGTEAIGALLSHVNLKKIVINSEISILSNKADCKRVALHRRRWLAQALLSSKPTVLTDMITKVLPVIPPDLRPLVLLENGNFATSDLNDLYRIVINRNNRLRKLSELNAPESILHNEATELQHCVDKLYDNKHCNQPVLGSSRRPLKSLTDMISGKQGRLRENLIGKRVDYSGTTTVVPDPSLPASCCAVPIQMLLTLLQPFLINHLRQTGCCSTIKSAKKFLETNRRDAALIVQQIATNHYVLIKRHPAFSQAGIGFFRVRPTNDQAIHVPSTARELLTMADGFDDIQIYLILSDEARLEAEKLSKHSLKQMTKPPYVQADMSPYHNYVGRHRRACKEKLDGKNVRSTADPLSLFTSCQMLRKHELMREYWSKRLYSLARYLTGALAHIEVTEKDCSSTHDKPSNEMASVKLLPLLRGMPLTSRKNQPSTISQASRSPLHCKTYQGLCKTCTGNQMAVGSRIGITASLEIMERLRTALCMMPPCESMPTASFEFPIANKKLPKGNMATIASIIRTLEGVKLSKEARLSPRRGTITSIRQGKAFCIIKIRSTEGISETIRFSKHCPSISS